MLKKQKQKKNWGGHERKGRSPLQGKEGLHYW